MKIQLPPLPYPLDALEPTISKQTLEHHYLKHHQAYVDKLNTLIAGTPYAEMDLEEIIIESSAAKSSKKEDQKIFNNAAQVWNHTFYWSSMNPERLSPTAKVDDAFKKDFGSVDQFYEKFLEAGVNLFGSGWVWLVQDESGTLSIVPKKDAETPLTDGLTPLLVCDVWEHAYYLDQQEKRAEYLKKFKTLINWSFVEKNLDQTKIFQANLNTKKPGETAKNVTRLN